MFLVSAAQTNRSFGTKEDFCLTTRLLHLRSPIETGCIHLNHKHGRSMYSTSGRPLYTSCLVNTNKSGMGNSAQAFFQPKKSQNVALLSYGKQNLKTASRFQSNCVDGHVHFRTDQLAAHESDILVDRQTNDILDVHLGFLQVRHVYDISFVIPCEIGPEPVFDPLENLHVKIKEIKSSDDGLGLHLIVEFNAQKEKLMKEKITLRSKNEPQKVLFLIFHARVLGKFKGTPSLRNGIHCVRIEPDDEEGSDWQGF